MNGLTTTTQNLLTRLPCTAVHKKLYSITLKIVDKIHKTLKITTSLKPFKYYQSTSPSTITHPPPFHLDRSTQFRPLDELITSGKQKRFQLFLELHYMSSSSLTSLGRRFHNFGATCENARSPYLLLALVSCSFFVRCDQE